MSDASPQISSALPRAAIPTRIRERWMLLALLPAAVLYAWLHAPMAAYTLAGAISAAVLFAAPLGGSDDRSSWFDRWVRASLMGMLVVLWLPNSPPLLASGLSSSPPWWVYAIAITLAQSVNRVFDSRIDGSPFHPAMVGCAVSLAFAPDALVSPLTGMVSIEAVSAAFFAGILLAIGRCIRWQTPLAFFIGSIATFFTWQLMTWQRIAVFVIFAAMLAQVLTAFFIATDPPSSCQSPRARWVQATVLGILSTLAFFVFNGNARAFLGMAGSMLLMNAAAPWLDRLFERPRAMQSTGISGP